MIAFRDIGKAQAIANIIVGMGHKIVSQWVLREEKANPRHIYWRDVNGVRRSEGLIAEVTYPSLGIGMEVMLAITMGKPVLALYQRGARVSKMLLGAPVTVRSYGSEEELSSHVTLWLDAVEWNRKYMVVIDLDETLWDHPDVTKTNPPYRRVGRLSIVDSNGERIKVRDGWVKSLMALKSIGVKLGIVSWNDPYRACEALAALGLRSIFDYIVVENHPDKRKMFKRLMDISGINPENILFIDDNAQMIRRVKEAYPKVHVTVYSGEIPNLSLVAKNLPIRSLK